MVFKQSRHVLLLHAAHQSSGWITQDGLYVAVKIHIPRTSKYPKGDTAHIGFYKQRDERVALLLPLNEPAVLYKPPPQQILREPLVIRHALYTYLNNWVRRQGATALFGCISSREILTRSVRL